MISLKIEDVKAFMSALLVHQIFDEFYVLQFELKTLFSTEISGKLTKEWTEHDDDQSDENKNRTYAFWKEMRPIAYELVKGKQTPSYMKISFEVPENMREKWMDQSTGQAGKCLMNIKYEKNELSIISGVSLNLFSLDKSFEHEWDDGLKEFLKQNNIVSTQLD